MKSNSQETLAHPHLIWTLLIVLVTLLLLAAVAAQIIPSDMPPTDRREPAPKTEQQ